MGNEEKHTIAGPVTKKKKKNIQVDTYVFKEFELNIFF